MSQSRHSKSMQKKPDSSQIPKHKALSKLVRPLV